MREFTNKKSHSRNFIRFSLLFFIILPVISFNNPITPLISSFADENEDWVDLINTTRMIEDINVLSSNQSNGRYPGTAGSQYTLNYLNTQLSELNVTPLTFREDFNQPFNIEPWTISINPINLTINDVPMIYNEDYTDLSFSGNTSILTPTELVFVGYGIDTKDYNDYYNLDVSGKIVIASRGAPPYLTYESGYTGLKAQTAFSHGARGLIIVNHPRFGSDDFVKGSLGPSNFISNIGSISANRTSLEQVGLQISTWLNDLDSNLSLEESYLGSQSHPTGIFATLEVNVQYKESVESANIIAKIQGQTNGTLEHAILISAHHDHLGESLIGEIYPGADDDASGVAVVLEVARVLNEFHSQQQFEKSVIIAFWGAEEIGLLGSYYFTQKNALFPLNRLDFMIQHDMVGLGPIDGKLMVDGGGYIPEEIMNDIREGAQQWGSISDVHIGWGMSDHIPFLEKNIAAVSFFWDEITNHPKYHTPQDEVEYIEPEVLKKVAATTLGYLLNYHLLNDSSNEETMQNVKDLIELILILCTFCVTIGYAFWFKKNKKIQ